MTRREDVAKIIDEWAWRICTADDLDTHSPDLIERWRSALERADAIIALSPPEPMKQCTYPNCESTAVGCHGACSDPRPALSPEPTEGQVEAAVKAMRELRYDCYNWPQGIMADLFRAAHKAAGRAMPLQQGTARLDGPKIAASIKKTTDRIDQVSEFLIGLFDKEPKATEMFARLMGIRSFLVTDAEEIATGLCCCRHVPDEDDTPCQRCGDTGVSEFVAAPMVAEDAISEGKK